MFGDGNDELRRMLQVRVKATTDTWALHLFYVLIFSFRLSVCLSFSFLSVCLSVCQGPLAENLQRIRAKWIDWLVDERARILADCKAASP